MKRIGILPFLLLFIPIVHADRTLIEEPQRSIVQSRTTEPNRSQQPQASTHPIVEDQSTEIQPARGTTEFRFSISADSCTHSPFYLTSHPRLIAGAEQWFLKTHTSFIQLKRDLTELQHIKLLWPETFNPELLTSYPLYFKLTPTSQLKATGIDIRPCNTVVTEDDGSAHRKGEILLLIKPNEELSITRSLMQDGFNISKRLQFYQNSLLITAKGRETQLKTLVEKLRSQFPRTIIDRNDYFFPAAQPRVYLRKSLNWPNISACIPSNDSHLSIGIIDGRIDTSHPALSDTKIETQSFSAAQVDDTTHATVIAGLISGHDQQNSLVGLLPKATLYSADVIESSSSGNAASVSAIVSSLDWLHRQSVRLVNLSLAGKTPNRVLAKSIQIASQHGMLIFAAAGNEHQTERPSYPAGFDNVFAITAIDAANQLYDHANQGDYIDFAAPGVDLWTADEDSAGQYRTGTSFATPLALAVAATYLSQNPSLPEALLYESLKRDSRDLGDKGHDPKFGWGLIQYPEHLCPPP